jgi:integrin beta 1
MTQYNSLTGQVYNVTIQYTQAKDYPIDLYFLMDLSNSMNDDKANLENLGEKMAETMMSVTSNFSLGFGSFVDKKTPPFAFT